MPEHRACRELFAPFALTIRQLSDRSVCAIQLDPGRRMVAGLLPPAKLEIHDCAAEPVPESADSEHLLHPQTRAPVVAARQEKFQ